MAGHSTMGRWMTVRVCSVGDMRQSAINIGGSWEYCTAALNLPPYEKIVVTVNDKTIRAVLGPAATISEATSYSPQLSQDRALACRPLMMIAAESGLSGQ